MLVILSLVDSKGDGTIMIIIEVEDSGGHDFWLLLLSIPCAVLCLCKVEELRLILLAALVGMFSVVESEIEQQEE